MELQIVDPRYYGGKGEAEQLCGAIYRGVAPAKDAFKPEAWNKYEITCIGRTCGSSSTASRFRT